MSEKDYSNKGEGVMPEVTEEKFDELNKQYIDTNRKLEQAFETIDKFSASIEHLQKSNDDLNTQLETAKAERVAAEKQAIVQEAETFSEQLKLGRVSYVPEGHGVSPAVVDAARFVELSELQDTSVTFTDGDSEKTESVSKVISVFAESVIKAAAKNELFVDLTEHAQSNDPVEEDKVNPESRATTNSQFSRDAQIRAHMVSSLGGEEKYDEAKGDWAMFSRARQEAMRELDLNDDYDEVPN